MRLRSSAASGRKLRDVDSIAASWRFATTAGAAPVIRQLAAWNGMKVSCARTLLPPSTASASTRQASIPPTFTGRARAP